MGFVLGPERDLVDVFVKMLRTVPLAFLLCVLSLLSLFSPFLSSLPLSSLASSQLLHPVFFVYCPRPALPLAHVQVLASLLCLFILKQGLN